MSKRYPPMRYVLPAVVDPPTSICYRVNVPNEPMHIAAFKGAIFNLAKAYSWGNDASHTAKAVAAVWRNVFDDLQECDDVAIQFQTVANCLLEVSYDGGTTWIPIFDASACANEVIGERIDDGTLAPGGQPPAAGTGDYGQCYSWKVKLDGNGRWKLPMRVDAGDVVTVSGVQGAWYNGAAYPVGVWNCGDGLVFALGACGGTPTFDGATPAPSVARMRLIGNGANESPAYFDMYNTSHTFNGAAQDFYLQANDESPEDNQGSLTLDVELCKGVGCPEGSDWSTYINFKTGLHGWSLCAGTQVNGTGIVGNFQDGSSRCEACVNIDVSSTGLKLMRAGVNRSAGAGANNVAKLYANHADYGAPYSGPVGTSVAIERIITLTPVTWLQIDSNLGEADCGTNVIEGIFICGTGTMPPEFT